MTTYTGSYTLEIDWSGDGTFGGGSEDVTADWLSARISRQFSTPLARVATVGRASFVLDNSSKAYSPPLVATAVPLRQVKFTMTYSAVSVVLFRGYIESIRPTFGPRLDRRVTIECVDALALLDQHESAIALQQDATADQIISALVSAAYTPPSTNYQSGINVFAWSADRWTDVEGRGVGYEEVTAARKIGDACASDWGRFFVSKAGAPTYYNRHQTTLDASTELTLSDDMVSMEYVRSDAEIFNLIEVTCHPRAIGDAYEVVGRISARSAPMVDASAAQKFVIEFRDPSDSKKRIGADGALTPVALTDYICTDDPEGEGTDVTASVSVAMTAYADRAEITLTNGTAGPCYVQRLNVRGYAVRVRAPVVVQAVGDTSAYKRKLRLNAPLISYEADAQLLADHLLDYYETVRHKVTGISFFANRSATFMAAARDLELLDRVVVTESQTGLSAYAGHIYQLDHQITNKANHRVTISLETAYPNPGTPFRLDTSALNSGHVLIY